MTPRGLVTAWIAGLIFGLGLLGSGMTNPRKVQDFLRVIDGPWDPSLGLVMAGAIAIGALGFAWVRHRQARGLPAWNGDAFDLPDTQKLTTRLIVGGALFGIGWGLGGFCPAPALIALVTAAPGAAWFVGAMLAGMLLHDAFATRAQR